MSVLPSSTPPPSTGYTPPLELLQAADDMLLGASPGELADAARGYVAHGRPTGGHSAITGAELPDFDVCRPLVRAGWLAVVRELCPPPKEPSKGTITVHVPELKVDVSDLKPELERLEGLVNQLTTAPVSMSDLCHGARALAEASTLLSTSDSDASRAVAALVQDMAKCLSAQVRELTPPQP
ncbi:hypothetical protein D187_007512 [Cystobacter fuscus DSM 2262]|uniref:Uncharacterized protein n=1 Tax=Cystobacter fuscus (strain ATCC 25194 / DSM 2262 / NBRC 100088 / M29) TaxID=1242864 RepID=S9NVH4_CYSF2|nr:hypothetical protein [Cystobacter fuscus]EPX56170.1 hypothetical protein D187_007512 [Cystobacter fuscus DSM 2262]